MTMLAPASFEVAAQVSIDFENRYPNVGTVMVWRVDEDAKPVELRGFASGTLIRDRVMVTAAKNPKTWIPVGLRNVPQR
jgi:hypothetical protein